MYADIVKALSSLVPPSHFDKPLYFSLDIAGVAGLFGGDDAVSAMATVYVYGNKRWLGWYNNPEPFQMAKRLLSFARSASIRSILGGSALTRSVSKALHADPTTLFGPEVGKGPRYRAAHSDTVLEGTGYLANLFMEECLAWEVEDRVIPGRKLQPIGITIADLGKAPDSETYHTRSSTFTSLITSVPIAISLGTCGLCALSGDWCAVSLILAGIIASGVSCLILGSADFVFTHPEPAKGSPPGDGILSSDKGIVLLRGTEGAVNSITHGRLSLRFANERHHNLIQWCSVLFFIQAVTQPLLVPQASLFGQVMFLMSLGVSALYNTWLSSLDKEMIHRKLLFERVLENPTLTKYTLGTHTASVVFILLVLQVQNPMGLLNELLPEDTKAWRQWKGTILESLCHPDDESFQFREVADLNGFAQQEKELLELLYQDARAAYDGYKDYVRIGSV